MSSKARSPNVPPASANPCIKEAAPGNELHIRLCRYTPTPYPPRILSSPSENQWIFHAILTSYLPRHGRGVSMANKKKKDTEEHNQGHRHGGDWVPVRGAMTVITGLSGSGKSSLAFDTIFAEGQRRYVESLSAYARQFLNQMSKPDVDEIAGL